MLNCDNCHKENQGKYRTIKIENKWTTLCWECLGEGQGHGKSDNEMQEYINTPYWLHMGLKPKPEEKEQLKYLKDHNMSWTDMSKVRNANATSKGGLEDFKKHKDKYGTKNAPSTKFGKISQASE
jgi:hypothetical protein